MLHAINAKKATLARIIQGVGRQPREDLVTSALFGSIEFLPLVTQHEAAGALLGKSLPPGSVIQLWPVFRGGSFRVEPDVIILSGNDLHVIEVKWGAHLGADQLARQLNLVSNGVCVRGDMKPAPRRITSLTVLGHERHHEEDIKETGDSRVTGRTWRDVAEALLMLRSDDPALAAWARAAGHFLSETPKARIVRKLPELAQVPSGSFRFGPDPAAPQPVESQPVVAGVYRFDTAAAG